MTAVATSLFVTAVASSLHVTAVTSSLHMTAVATSLHVTAVATIVYMRRFHRKDIICCIKLVVIRRVKYQFIFGKNAILTKNSYLIKILVCNCNVSECNMQLPRMYRFHVIGNC